MNGSTLSVALRSLSVPDSSLITDKKSAVAAKRGGQYSVRKKSLPGYDVNQTLHRKRALNSLFFIARFSPEVNQDLLEDRR